MGQRVNVHLDHIHLPLDRQRGHHAHRAEPGIIDNHVYLHLPLVQQLPNFRRRAGGGQIFDKDGDRDTVPLTQLPCQLTKFFLAPSNQHDMGFAAGKAVGQLKANPRRSAGNQNGFLSGVHPSCHLQACRGSQGCFQEKRAARPQPIPDLKFPKGATPSWPLRLLFCLLSTFCNLAAGSQSTGRCRRGPGKSGREILECIDRSTVAKVAQTFGPGSNCRNS